MNRDRNDQKFLAHSPPKEGLPGDPYARHVTAVCEGALKRAQEMLTYAPERLAGIGNSIGVGGNFHDIGKLEPENQGPLHQNRGSKLKWDHIDAGVAHLSTEKDWMAAWLVRAHHAPGIPEKAEHFTEKTDRRLRGCRHDSCPKQTHDDQIARTNKSIKEYLRDHESVLGSYRIQPTKPVHGLTMRLALSCLVDADHSDSAFFDTGRRPPEVSKTRWPERLRALREYVESLPVGKDEAQRARNVRRTAFFNTCLNSPIKDPIVSCEGPVGLGKTTAVTAYLICRAIEEGLRRIIIIAPFTNILTQTAKRLRKALTLPGENPDQVIVEHHHRADFAGRSDRELAVLWRAPIVLTTAVSFFETLSSCNPAVLRKFHAVPGSGIFLDEAHQALPTKLWPQNWKWLNELAHVWGCRVVLASGSLARFWEQEEIVEETVSLPDLLPKCQATDVFRDERIRVKYSALENGHFIGVDQLIEHVKKAPGPRLVILNTVQNAAIVAHAMRRRGMVVLHISTALTPSDREAILNRIERMLLFRNFWDWTLVATSCVEAGVDLSFRCAFRERFSAASAIQVGGRVNRHGEYNAHGGGEVYDFALSGAWITQHPAAAVSAEVLRDLMDRGELNKTSPADIVTEAMKQELRYSGSLPSDLIQAEKEKNYPKVEELGRVIDTDTRFVIIDPRLEEALRNHEKVDFNSLLRGSVQMWSNKINSLGLKQITRYGRASDMYSWEYEYDPDFLGYMAGVLRHETFLSEGGAII